MTTQRFFRYYKPFQQCGSHDAHTTNIPLTDLVTGLNFVDHLIINRAEDGRINFVISNVCDHANGTLEINPNGTTATCPLHGWTLDLTTLRYSNVGITKQPLAHSISDGTLSIDNPDYHLKFPLDDALPKPERQQVRVRHLAHACLLFDFNGYKLITDPWLEGPCFANGWWHAPAPASDALEQLLAADCVYISHNHADHLHSPTLQKLAAARPDVPIIAPAFKTQSTIRPLRSLGFTNAHALSFNQICQINDSALFLSILKSGDFRDDSGLYVKFGEFQGVLTVDSSILNHLVLPQPIDFLATSFASGASGYPWCFENQSIDQREQITRKRREAALRSVNEYIDATQPRVYMPYAGYFTELAERDQFIRRNNRKNSAEEVIDHVQRNYPDVACIHPIQTDTVTFDQQALLFSDSSLRPNTHWSTAQVQEHLQSELEPTQQLLNEIVRDYFKNCGFSDTLELYLQPCADDFSPSLDGYCVNFCDAETQVSGPLESTQLQAKYDQSGAEDIRKLMLHVRAASLFDVLQHRKPWEELSIGFQCRIWRNPDVYNSDFWYHFSNIYIEYVK